MLKLTIERELVMNPEVIANLILAFCFGFTIAIFITPIFVYLKKIMYHPTQKKKLLEEAKKSSCS